MPTISRQWMTCRQVLSFILFTLFLYGLFVKLSSPSIAPSTASLFILTRCRVRRYSSDCQNVGAFVEAYVHGRVAGPCVLNERVANRCLQTTRAGKRTQGTHILVSNHFSATFEIVMHIQLTRVIGYAQLLKSLLRYFHFVSLQDAQFIELIQVRAVQTLLAIFSSSASLFYVCVRV